jgi:spermidine synthase
MDDGVLYEGDTELGHYQVVDTVYSGRPARVLYSGAHQAAQSGMALDDNSELLFDYNERFMELCRGLLPHRALLIGGGACTFPKALLEEFPDITLDIVEIDGQLIDLAKQFFDFIPSSKTSIYTDDAKNVLTSLSGNYDAIYIDAFTHTTVPAFLQSVEMTTRLLTLLNKKGAVAMNIIAAYSGVRADVLKRQVAAFQAAFERIEIFPASANQSLWLPQNFVLTAHNRQTSLEGYVRHAPIQPTIN